LHNGPVDYPVFTPENVPCTDDSNKGPIRMGYSDIVLCAAGCFHGDTQIAFLDDAITEKPYAPILLSELTSFVKWIEIFSAYTQKDDVKRRVMTLSQEATIDNLSFDASDIDYWITDRIPQRQTMIRLETESGVTLLVSENHPMLAADGRVIDASFIPVDMELVNAEGFADKVTVAEKTSFFGKVYNLDTKSQNFSDKFILASDGKNGALVSGTHYFQDAGTSLLNSIVLWNKVASQF
jgi:hypothetical protein